MDEFSMQEGFSERNALGAMPNCLKFAQVVDTFLSGSSF